MPSGHLAVHSNRCGCTPMFEQIKSLARHSQILTREIHEAYYIRLYGPDVSVGAESVTVCKEEFELI